MGTGENVPRIRTLVLILAGGAGGRLELLTHTRAKPAVSFAGTHRLIDFPLSNCMNSAISDVWVAQQYNPASLSDHLSNGRPWDLDRTRGGLLVLHPSQGNDGSAGFAQGTADVLWGNAKLIREFDPRALVVVSADAVYKLDYRALVEEHCEAGKTVTLVTTTVDPEDAGRYGVVQTKGGKVTGYALKPDDPDGNLITNEVFVFEPHRVLDTLDELAEEAGEDGLEDLGHELLPRLVDDGEVCEHRFDGYWRDVGTIQSYWECHQELVLRRAADRPRRARLADPHPRPGQPRVRADLLERGGRLERDRARRDGRGQRRGQRGRARGAGRRGRGGARGGPAARQHRPGRREGRAGDPRRRRRGPRRRG